VLVTLLLIIASIVIAEIVASIAHVALIAGIPRGITPR
jgi:hypothetical protein